MQGDLCDCIFLREPSFCLPVQTVAWHRPGHSIAVGVDMFSDMYLSANEAEDLRMTIGFDGSSVLRVPML